MTIDAHQHFWQYNPVKDAWITEDMAAIRRDFLPANLRKELQKNKVDGSVVVQAAPTEEETNFLLDIANKNEFVKGVVGWVDLTGNDIEKRLAYYYDHADKLVGFRHTVQDEPDDEFLLRKDFCHGISRLSKYNYTYDILVYPHQLPAVVQFIERFPEQKFVIDHMAKPYIKAGKVNQWAETMKTIARYPKVYCKLSGIITEADWKNWNKEQIKPYLDVVFEAFGSERLMYGSDWPVCLVAGRYSEVKELIFQYIESYGQEEQQAIMGRNAENFYQL